MDDITYNKFSMQIHRWLRSYNFRCFCSLTLLDLAPQVTASRIVIERLYIKASKDLKILLRNISKTEKVQVCCIYFLTKNLKSNSLHFHVFLSVAGKKGISKISKRKWEKNWRWQASIQAITSWTKLVEYISKHFTVYDYIEVDYYNRKLLEKIKW